MDTRLKINKSLNNILAQLDKLPVVGVMNCQRIAIIANEAQLIREYVNSSTQSSEKKEETASDADNSDDTDK